MILPVIRHPRTERGVLAVKSVIALAVILGLTSPVLAANPLGKPSDGLRLQATLGTNAPAVFLPGQTIPLDVQLVNVSKAQAYPVVKSGDGWSRSLRGHPLEAGVKRQNHTMRFF